MKSSVAEAIPSQIMQIFNNAKRLTVVERLMLANLLLASILSDAPGEKVDWTALMTENCQQEQDDVGWPPGFFEATAGAWAGETLVREEQGDYEIRDEQDW